jgi:hypothetical protein
LHLDAFALPFYQQRFPRRQIRYSQSKICSDSVLRSPKGESQLKFVIHNFNPITEYPSMNLRMWRFSELAAIAMLMAGQILGLAAIAPDVPIPPRTNWSAENYIRKTIYHSPQKPGYTCWVGAWEMPDHNLMVTFKEVTGPLKGRLRTRPEWAKAFGLMNTDPARDFTGLHLSDLYLHSTNGGTSWVVVGRASYTGPSLGYAWSGSHCPMPDGTIISRSGWFGRSGSESTAAGIFSEIIRLGAGLELE